MNLFDLQVCFKKQVLKNVIHDVASFHEELGLYQMDKRVIVDVFAMFIVDLFQSMSSCDHERDVWNPLTEKKKSFPSGPWH